MADGMKVKVRSGRVRGPNLSDPQLRIIGDRMVAEQKARWSQAVNADGVAAKKLSVRYSIIKQAVLHKRPSRDNSMTGLLVSNFSLRKAAEGIIRAENTTRLARDHARRANGYDQMIGFAVSDARVVFGEMQGQYGEYVKTAWIPLGTTGGGEFAATKSSYSSGSAANKIFVPGGSRTRRPSLMGKRPRRSKGS